MIYALPCHPSLSLDVICVLVETAWRAVSCCCFCLSCGNMVRFQTKVLILSALSIFQSGWEKSECNQSCGKLFTETDFFS